MIIDAQNMFSNKQVLSGNSTSTNTIGLSGVRRNIGTGQPLYIMVALLADPAGEITVSLVQSGYDAQGAATPDEVIQEVCIIPSTAKAGDKFFAAIRPGVVTDQDIKLKYETSGAVTITAAITESVDDPNFYPDNRVIS